MRGMAKLFPERLGGSIGQNFNWKYESTWKRLYSGWKSDKKSTTKNTEINMGEMIIAMLLFNPF